MNVVCSIMYDHFANIQFNYGHFQFQFTKLGSCTSRGISLQQLVLTNYLAMPKKTIILQLQPSWNNSIFFFFRVSVPQFSFVMHVFIYTNYLIVSLFKDLYKEFRNLFFLQAANNLPK